MRGLKWLLAVGVAAAVIAPPALAHEGSGGDRLEWSFEPWALVPLSLCLVFYLAGLVRLFRRADKSRATVLRNAALFLTGWLILAGATISPLHEGGERSFTLHMIEHELIMLVAAPLMALSRPLGVMIWSLPASERIALSGWARRGATYAVWRHATAPLTATLVQIAVIWLWHVPGPFELALRHEGWHVAQHLCFLISALLFWWAMAFGRNGAHGYGLSSLCLFITSLAEGGLGALMTFSMSPWYADYAAMRLQPMGLSPEQDQQLAGLIMWIPGGMLHAVVAVFMMLRWIGSGTPSAAIAPHSQ